MVNPGPGPTSKDGEAGTNTNPLVPILNAKRTSPLVKLMSFVKVPLLVPTMSRAFPSPGHQLTSPDKGGVDMILPVWVRTPMTIFASTRSRAHSDTPAKSRTFSYAIKASSVGTCGSGNGRPKGV